MIETFNPAIKGKYLSSFSTTGNFSQPSCEQFWNRKGILCFQSVQKDYLNISTNYLELIFNYYL